MNRDQDRREWCGLLKAALEQDGGDGERDG
jgi:hypothetical protein